MVVALPINGDQHTVHKNRLLLDVKLREVVSKLDEGTRSAIGASVLFWWVRLDEFNSDGASK
jgi:hypothetical protein